MYLLYYIYYYKVNYEYRVIGVQIGANIIRIELVRSEGKDAGKWHPIMSSHVMLTQMSSWLYCYFCALVTRLLAVFSLTDYPVGTAERFHRFTRQMWKQKAYPPTVNPY